jgi:hypothetical protein
LPHYQLSQNTAYRPHVGRRTVVPGAQQYFWGSVNQSDVVFAVLHDGSELLGHSEVNNFELTKLGKHQVLGLYVTVHNEVGVQIVSAFQDLLGQIFNVFQLERHLLLQERAHRTAPQKLNHDARTAIHKLEHFDQIGQVRISQSPQLLEHVDLTQRRH